MRNNRHLTYQNKLTLISVVILALFFSKGNAQFTVNGQTLTPADTVVRSCINGQVGFVSTVKGTISWNLEGANPSSVNSSIAVVTYSATGTFLAVQTVSTPDTTYKVSVWVKISDDYPTAQFTITPPASHCANENFRLKNTSSGDIVTGIWGTGPCGGNGSIRTLNDYNLTFQSIGNGTLDCPVYFTVGNSSGCYNTATQTVSVKQIPDAKLNDISGPPEVFVAGRQVYKSCGATLPFSNTFFNTSTTAATNVRYDISWNDDKTTFSSTEFPDTGVSHNFKDGYTLFYLRVTGQNGCSSLKDLWQFVSQEKKPTAGLTAQPFGLICAPQKLDFSIPLNTNTNGTTYRLFLNDRSPAANYTDPPPPIISINALYGSCGVVSTDGTTTYPNALRAGLIAENPCGSDSAFVLPIYASAKAKPGVNSPVSVCANTSIIIGNAGNYGSVVTVQNGIATCTYNGKHVWQISPASYVIDSGSLGNINGNYSDISGWQTGSDTFKITFTDTGIYTIKQFIGNGGCGTDSIIRTICVSKPSQAAFTLNTKQGCPGNTTFRTNNTTLPGTGSCAGEYYIWQITPINTPTCKSGNKYEFQNGTTTLTKNIEVVFHETGLYQIQLVCKLSALSSCLTVFTDTIGIYDKPNVSISTLSEICAGDPISPKVLLTDCLPNKFQTYKWKFTNGTPSAASDSTPTDIRFNLPGNTFITLETSNACGTDFDTAYILINEKPQLDRVNDTTICSNNPISLSLASSSGSNTVYTWTSRVVSGTDVIGNTNQTKQSVLTINDKLTNNGTTNAIIEYKIIAEPTTLPFKCPSDSATVYITVLPHIQAGKDTLLCLGKFLPLNAIGTNVVKWSWTPAVGLSNANISNPVTTSALTNSTTYFVTGTTALGCSDTDTIQVNVTEPFNLTVSPTDGYTCIDSAIQLQAFGGSTYSWTPAATLNDANIANPIARPSQTTTYTVTSSDQYNCEVKTDEITVSVGGFTNVDLTSSSVRQVLAGTQIPLFANTDSANIKKYVWTADPTDGASFECLNASVCSQQLATIYKDVTFSVEVENIYGCKQKDTISFQASCISEKQLFVPTAFTPNGNSLNDIFTILGQGFTINYFKIYNRWGNVVFERKNGGKPNDKAYGWNGQLKDGGMAPSGNYTCIVEVTCTAGGIFTYKGNLTLIR
jgi:gliding motility-associated-like protein